MNIYLVYCEYYVRHRVVNFDARRGTRHAYQLLNQTIMVSVLLTTGVNNEEVNSGEVQEYVRLGQHCLLSARAHSSG